MRCKLNENLEQLFNLMSKKKKSDEKHRLGKCKEPVTKSRQSKESKLKRKKNKYFINYSLF